MSDEHRCDRYALANLPGVSFCRKAGARIVAEKLEDVAAEAERKALERALAVVFLRCQPDHGDLFAAIDDEFTALKKKEPGT